MTSIHPGYALGALAAMAVVTFGLRALPFLAAKFLQRHPLVVGSARANPAGPWAELAAVSCVLGLQWWRKHALLSILAGTALYVLLRNAAWLG